MLKKQPEYLIVKCFFKKLLLKYLYRIDFNNYVKLNYSFRAYLYFNKPIPSLIGEILDLYLSDKYYERKYKCTFEDIYLRKDLMVGEGYGIKESL